MLYRPVIHESRPAHLARRLGSLAIPVLALAIIGHRFFGLTSQHAFALIIVSVGLAAAAVVFALIATVAIWERGYLGAGAAFRGLLYGLIALTPAAFGAWGVYSYPRLNDVSTDVSDPPLYKYAAFARAGTDNAVRPISAENAAKQRQAYPDIVTRRFTIGSDQLFAAAKKVALGMGWRITDEQAPKDENDRGVLEAVAKTLIMGFLDDVAIRIYAEPTGSRIDIRSSSRFGEQDLGANARRIRAFYAQLDEAVSESYGP
jgi:hypothetical protein